MLIKTQKVDIFINLDIRKSCCKDWIEINNIIVIIKYLIINLDAVIYLYFLWSDS